MKEKDDEILIYFNSNKTEGKIHFICVLYKIEKLCSKTNRLKLQTLILLTESSFEKNFIIIFVT